MGLTSQLGVAGRELLSFAKQASLLRHDARPTMPHEARPGDDVVVCLHGLFASAGVLRPLRERLETTEGVHTASLSYEPGRSVRTLARRVAELVAELPRGVHVHLLGHSLGGVVVRYCAIEFADPRVVQTISMATPFAGVRHAGRLGLELGRELDPQSPLLRQLMLSSRRELGIPHLSIVADNDQVVRAPRSHALPGGDVVVVRECGHNSLLYHPDAASHVETRVLDRSPARRQR